MARNSFQRNEIPEPPSIAVMSPLGWAAMLPALAEQARSSRVAEEESAVSDASRESPAHHRIVRHSLRSAVLALLGGRRSTAAWIRSAFADEMTSAG
jgi:hypothetical protein